LSREAPRAAPRSAAPWRDGCYLLSSDPEHLIDHATGHGLRTRVYASVTVPAMLDMLDEP